MSNCVKANMTIIANANPITKYLNRIFICATLKPRTAIINAINTIIVCMYSVFILFSPLNDGSVKDPSVFCSYPLMLEVRSLRIE